METRIKNLLKYGLINPDEIEVILAIYRRENRSHKDDLEIINIIKKNIKSDIEQEKRLENELDELLNNELTLEKRIIKARLDRAKKVGQQKGKHLKSIEKEYENKRKMHVFEYNSAKRKIETIIRNAEAENDNRKLQKIREKLNSK